MAIKTLTFYDDCFCIVHNGEDVEMRVEATASVWSSPQTRYEPADEGFEVEEVNIYNPHYTDGKPIDVKEIEKEVCKKIRDMDYDEWGDKEQEEYEDYCCREVDKRLGKKPKKSSIFIKIFLDTKRIVRYSSISEREKTKTLQSRAGEKLWKQLTKSTMMTKTNSLQDTVGILMWKLHQCQKMELIARFTHFLTMRCSMKQCHLMKKQLQ